MGRCRQLPVQQHCPTMDVAPGAVAGQGHWRGSHRLYLSHALLTPCSHLSSGHGGIVAPQCVPCPPRDRGVLHCPDALGHQFEELQGVV